MFPSALLLPWRTEYRHLMASEIANPETKCSRQKMTRKWHPLSFATEILAGFFNGPVQFFQGFWVDWHSARIPRDSLEQPLFFSHNFRILSNFTAQSPRFTFFRITRSSSTYNIFSDIVWDLGKFYRNVSILLQVRSQKYSLLWFSLQLQKNPRPHPSLPISPHFSPFLPISPHFSPFLPATQPRE